MVAAMCALESDTMPIGRISPFPPLSVLVSNTGITVSCFQFQSSVSESDTGNRPESRAF